MGEDVDAFRGTELSPASDVGGNGNGGCGGTYSDLFQIGNARSGFALTASSGRPLIDSAPGTPEFDHIWTVRDGAFEDFERDLGVLTARSHSRGPFHYDFHEGEHWRV